MVKIIVKNAVKRKTGWIYFIDFEGNLCGYDFRRRLREDVKRKKTASREKTNG